MHGGVRKCGPCRGSSTEKPWAGKVLRKDAHSKGLQVAQAQTQRAREEWGTRW